MIDINVINEKKNKLEEIKIVLKEKFIGIDDIIDKIINSISLWYLIPEFQLRPLIVNLWGITGVGKTDLVRTLVKLLNFNNKFIEIQLDIKDDYNRNIQDYLETMNLETDEPSILLLDEMQRFRSVDENGKMLETKYFNDIWMLLSDGKFQNDFKRKNEILSMFFDELYYSDDNKTKTSKNEEDLPANEDKIVKSSKLKYYTSYWSANRLKKLLKNNLSIEEIMKLNVNEKITLLQNSLSDDNINEGKTYSKMLIFVSGNLDEAYYMADNVDECEQDADIYNALSKNITLIDIKNALLKKFKPEQIARLGNNHIIYPCLSKNDYYNIIKKYTNQILNNISKKNNTNISVTDIIYDIIYRNGVFPTQGVRPVISSISNIIECNIPYFLFIAFENNVNNFIIDFDINTNELFAIIKEKKYAKKITLDIDSIRKNKSIDEKILILVHELGHALAHALLYNIPPKQINLNAVGFSNGFIINQSTIDNRTFLLNKIMIALAGLVAEEFIFGNDYKSNGCSMDLKMATSVAGKYIRNYGMNGTISYISPVERGQFEYDLNYDVSISNNEIEHILVEQKKKIEELFKNNIKLFKKLLNFAISNNNTIEIKDFVKICNDNNLNIIDLNVDDKIIYKYSDKLQKFLNN